MRVRFDTSVMNSARDFFTLDRIVYHFDDERHKWDVPNPTEVEESAWLMKEPLSRATRRTRELLEKAVANSMYWDKEMLAHRITVTVTCNPTNKNDLVPAKAVRALDEQVKVFVENVESDGHFLLTMMHAFSRTFLEVARDKNWWDFSQMGGFGEVEKSVSRHLGQISGPARVFVVTDSDAQHPSDYTQTHQKVSSACEALGVKYTILSKRSIENYLPIDILQSTNRRSTFNAFLTLNELQKDYYDMKRGFDVDEFQGSPSNAGRHSLFRHLRIHIVRDLVGGFGRNVAGLFASEKHRFTREIVLQRCSQSAGEIEAMLDQIESLI